jgi:hypothetical protein
MKSLFLPDTSNSVVQGEGTKKAMIMGLEKKANATPAAPAEPDRFEGWVCKQPAGSGTDEELKMAKPAMSWLHALFKSTRCKLLELATAAINPKRAQCHGPAGIVAKNAPTLAMTLKTMTMMAPHWTATRDPMPVMEMAPTFSLHNVASFSVPTKVIWQSPLQSPPLPVPAK